MNYPPQSSFHKSPFVSVHDWEFTAQFHLASKVIRVRPFNNESLESLATTLINYFVLPEFTTTHCPLKIS